MAKVKGRAKHFQDPDEVIAKDYDPESNVAGSDQGGDSSDSDASENENLATEHYVPVGKSKLRQKENVSLGPEYRGSRVSRAALDEDDSDENSEEEDHDDNGDYDDPDAADLEADEAEANDSEIESDNALGESDAERFKKFAFRGSSKPAKPKGKAGRVTAADFMSDEEEEEEEESGSDEDMDDGLDALVNGDDSGSEEEEDDDDDDGEDESEDEDDDDRDGDGDEDEDEDEDEEEPAKAVNNPRPNMSALSNRSDVDKGIAIQKQRKIYDGLLNLRIRLQKALVATNSFPTIESEADVESEPYEAAEEAAIKLLNTISSLRENFSAQEKTGEKRKRVLAVSMSDEDIWEQLQQEDRAAVGFRDERLEKWSKKVQSVNMVRPNRLSQQSKTLVDALKEQLITPNNRLLRRTKVPRSCAPAQVAKKLTEDEYIYDDADFYQLLLKELVDQRTVDGSGNETIAVPTVMVSATKEAKMRKQVDRKASKGRKMRFTVHEKLQNFMAPEDRRSWELGAIDRFFGTLFGRKMELNEDESEDEDMEGVDAEEEGLKLFRI
ncbi:rRNA-processing protein bfr2 [Conoideocrella luteorostrata]|uniref:Protein BFR2 n=1 Tax=Conoideocrella luteorostrata TaxID=1105319 RepID=A0AAJ0CBY9_9HYPO|nr:rRNA-processing protein bfr2 [Conoideocrella luteorostrata]